MILHGYWRSGTSYRTRIALNLKGVEYRQAALDLRTGAQKSEAYLRLNPHGGKISFSVRRRLLRNPQASLAD